MSASYRAVFIGSFNHNAAGAFQWCQGSSGPGKIAQARRHGPPGAGFPNGQAVPQGRGARAAPGPPRNPSTAPISAAGVPLVNQPPVPAGIAGVTFLYERRYEPIPRGRGGRGRKARGQARRDRGPGDPGVPRDGHRLRRDRRRPQPGRRRTTEGRILDPDAGGANLPAARADAGSVRSMQPDTHCPATAPERPGPGQPVRGPGRGAVAGVRDTAKPFTSHNGQYVNPRQAGDAAWSTHSRAIETLIAPWTAEPGRTTGGETRTVKSGDV